MRTLLLTPLDVVFSGGSPFDADLQAKAEWTANPVQTTAFLVVKKGSCWNAIDGGNPWGFESPLRHHGNT